MKWNGLVQGNTANACNSASGLAYEALVVSTSIHRSTASSVIEHPCWNCAIGTRAVKISALLKRIMLKCHGQGLVAKYMGVKCSSIDEASV